MGIELLISELTNFKKDEKGRDCHTVIDLYNFSNSGYTILKNIGSLEYELNNGCTKLIDGADLVECLKQIKKQLKEKSDQNDKNFILELKEAINDLEYFFEENNIEENIRYGDRTFEVYLSY